MKDYLNLTGLSHFLDKLTGKFVAKVDGKGLSTNDYTTEEKEKLASLVLATDDDIIALMQEVDAFPVVMDESGAIMTDEDEAILLA